MNRKTLLSTIILGALIIPIAASAFRAENGTTVTPAAGNTFEVNENSRFGVPGQWCAAASYAVRKLGAQWKQPIYVLGPGSKRRSVIFGFDPAGATPSKITVVSRSANTPGAFFTVQRAHAFCIDQRGSRTDR